MRRDDNVVMAKELSISKNSIAKSERWITKYLKQWTLDLFYDPIIQD